MTDELTTLRQRVTELEARNAWLERWLLVADSLLQRCLDGFDGSTEDDIADYFKEPKQ